jgi:catechol 2,3-dioxygenase-like lactoylglutathione lyase family enzyme
MARPFAQFCHLGIYAADFPAMVEFYCGLLGMTVSDRDVVDGQEWAFLSASDEEHHQVVLASGRPKNDGALVINQISFKCGSLTDLKGFYDLARQRGVEIINAASHGNAWSLYVRDPDGNRVEIYAVAPWYVQQPFRVPLDLSKSEAEIRAETEKMVLADPTGMSNEAWRAKMRDKMKQQSPV